MKEIDDRMDSGEKEKACSDAEEKGLDLKSEIKWWSKAIVASLAVAFFINSEVVVNAVVPTGSMENTIKPGDRFLGNRLAYVKAAPERFDVIVFKFPDDESLTYIKRVIGLPGEKVEIRDGKVYIDGCHDPLDDSFIPEAAVGDYGPYYVREGCYFVLGDNRNNSKDSRLWVNTFVKREQIIGKALFCYWPLRDVGVIE